MCGKAVNSHLSTMKFVPESLKLRNMCYKAVHRYFFSIRSIPDQYKTQEISNIVVSLYPFFIVYCTDRYKTQRMCDEAADDSAAALKFIPAWFVTSKMVKNLSVQKALYLFVRRWWFTVFSWRFWWCYVFLMKWVFLV